MKDLVYEAIINSTEVNNRMVPNRTDDFWYCDVRIEDGLSVLEEALSAAQANNDFEVVAIIRNYIADIKDESRPYNQQWFADL